jgi:hypothetical protein
MALTPFTGTITEAVLRSNFDDATATMLTNLRAGGKDQTVHLRLASLASGADLSLRSVAWTQQDDAELRILHARVTDTAARAIGVALEVENGDTIFLVDKTVSIAITTANGTVDTRPTSSDYRTVTGTRLRLVKGVRYRLMFTNTSGGTVGGPLQANVQLRSIRRRA